MEEKGRPRREERTSLSPSIRDSVGTRLPRARGDPPPRQLDQGPGGRKPSRQGRLVEFGELHFQVKGAGAGRKGSPRPQPALRRRTAGWVGDSVAAFLFVCFFVPTPPDTRVWAPGTCSARALAGAPPPPSLAPPPLPSLLCSLSHPLAPLVLFNFLSRTSRFLPARFSPPPRRPERRRPLKPGCRAKEGGC